MEALFIGACSQSPHQSRPRRRPAHIKRKRSLELFFKMRKKRHLNWIAAGYARMENEPVYHARSLYASSERQSAASGPSSSSSSSTSTSESGTWALMEQTRTKTASASIRSNSTIKGTSLPWSATRANEDSDSNDYCDGPSFHDNDSINGSDLHPDSNTNGGKRPPWFRRRRAHPGPLGA